MTAFNVVRFRVKPGREQEFLDAHRGVRNEWSGLKKVNMIKTGDRTYCIIAEWAAYNLVANRQHDRDLVPRERGRPRRQASTGPSPPVSLA